MTKTMRFITSFLLFAIPIITIAQGLSEEFKQHWFDGYAEINSYELKQSRYGEDRNGKAVLIFVTEDFLKNVQVKADRKSKTTIAVLKSNRTKNFITGIYPYSIMSSSFVKLKSPYALIKNSASIQEWCGHSYLQINRRKNKLEVTSHSYFEGQADQNIILNGFRTEDEIWNLIRLQPQKLPTGNIKLVLSLESIRLSHKPIQVYDASASIEKNEKTSVYTIKYPTLDRSLSIEFQNAFPYTIEGWVETFNSRGKIYTSTATRIHTERRKYWQENDNASQRYRIPFKIN